ncbi:MAG: NADAR family protein [Eubacterium sp.]|nr:NADAR family protein [Eubacterium sp.]
MIKLFRGAYEFLSNYYDPCPIQYKGKLYRNSEAAYQAQKCKRESDKEMFTSLSPDNAKQLGKQIEMVPDWDDNKARIMLEVVQAKFEQHGELATLLLQTGKQDLVEGNYWHDNFFGDCQCPNCRDIPGENWLGIILMAVRDKIRYEGENI